MNSQAALLKRLANASLSKIHPTTSIKGETQLRKTILATGLLNKVRQQQAISFNDWLLSRHDDDLVSTLEDDERQDTTLPTSSPDNNLNGDTTANPAIIERSFADINKWDDNDNNNDNRGDGTWGTQNNISNDIDGDADKSCVWNWLIDSVKDIDHENAASILIGLLAPANTTPITTSLPALISSVMEENTQEVSTTSKYDFVDTTPPPTLKRSFSAISSPSDTTTDPTQNGKRVKDSTSSSPSRPSSPVTLSA